jgi:hypothetical protein
MLARQNDRLNRIKVTVQLRQTFVRNFQFRVHNREIIEKRGLRHWKIGREHARANFALQPTGVVSRVSKMDHSSLGKALFVPELCTVGPEDSTPCRGRS